MKTADPIDFAEKPTPGQEPKQLDLELAVGSGTNLWDKYQVARENPDEVVRKKGLRVFEQMEAKDGHYASVLQTRKLALLGRGYEIQPASDDPRAQEQAAFVRWNLEQMRGSFLQDRLEILDGLGKGFSLSELVWTRIERGPYKGLIGLKAIKAKDQNAFGFATDEFDNILPDGILQNPLMSHGMRMANTLSWTSEEKLRGSSVQGTNVRLPREKFVHFVFNGRAENPYGRGLGAACYWYSWFKTEGFKFWMIFLERFGSPTVQVEVEGTVGTAEEEQLQTILQQIQQETGFMVPKGVVVSLLEAARTGDASYETLVATCNAEISKVVLGQTLTSQQGSVGSLALGEVHNEVRLDLLRYDAEAHSTCVNEQIIQRMVDFNWLDVETYPRFVISFRPQRDAGSFTTALRGLVDMGAKIPLRYAHEELGIPQAQEGEEILAASAAPAPFFQRGGPEFSERPLTRNQLSSAALHRRAHQEQDALIDAGVAQAQTAVEQIVERLIAQVKSAGAIEAGTYNAPLAVNTSALRDAMLRTGVMARLTGQLLAVEQLEDKGLSFDKKRMASFAEGDLVTLDEAAALFKQRLPIDSKAFNRLVADLKRRYFAIAGIEEGELLKQAQAALIEAIDTGGTLETFSAALKERAVKYTGVAFGRNLAGKELGDYHLRTLFRTNTMGAYNEGRREIFEDPDVADDIVAYMYNAIDDDRVRPAHAAMDGKIYAKDSPVWAQWWPPNGYNCRCTVDPITRDEAARIAPETISTALPAVGDDAVRPDPGFGGVTK